MAVAAVVDRTMIPPEIASAVKMRLTVFGKPENGESPIVRRDRLYTHLYTHRRIALGDHLNKNSKYE